MSEWTEAHDGLLKRAQRAEARIAELEAALRDLVTLKDYRDWRGKTPEYLEKKPAVWLQARHALESAKDKT